MIVLLHSDAYPHAAALMKEQQHKKAFA